VHRSLEVKHYLVQAKRRRFPPRAWPLHDIVLTNIVWCLANKRVSRGGGGALRDIVCKKIQGGDIKEVVRANNRID